jgi:hypothetical protein
MKRNLLSKLLLSNILLLLANFTAWGQTITGVTVSTRNSPNDYGYILASNFTVNLQRPGTGTWQYRVQVSNTPVFPDPVECRFTSNGCNTIFVSSTSSATVSANLGTITAFSFPSGDTFYIRAQAIQGPITFNNNTWGNTLSAVAYRYSIVERIESPLTTPDNLRPRLIPSSTTVRVSAVTGGDQYGLGYNLYGQAVPHPPVNQASSNDITVSNLQVGTLYSLAGTVRFDPNPNFGPYSSYYEVVVYEPPIITDPADGSTVQTVFNATLDGPLVNLANNGSTLVKQYQIQWSTDPDNFPSDPDENTSEPIDASDPTFYDLDLDFDPGQKYYLRARALMSLGAFGGDVWGWYGAPIAVQVELPGLSETYLNLVDINTPVSPYFDSYTYDLAVVPVSGASSYEWELYMTSNVNGVNPAPVPVRTNTTITNVWPGLLTTEYISGGEYFLRVRARSVNATTGVVVYSPWTSNANMAASHYFNSLHPGRPASPAGDIANSLQRTLKCLPVANNDLFGYFFQIATDPDFQNVVVNAPNYGGTEFIPEIDGGRAVFRANGWDVGNNQPRFVYFRSTAYNTTYYMRVRTFRTDGAGNFLQTGYWMSGPEYTTSFRFVVAREGFEGKFEPVDMTKLTFYPNPFTGNGLINIPAQYGQVKVQVVNTLGMTVEEIDASGGQILNLGRTWKSGVYMLRVSDGDQLNQTIRIVKQ